ncbi:MAG: hypothetical protein E7364_01975 [Clostridiales bacterium]|nr:hypothetical protein [Clostridiales bacterium]
MKKRFSLFAALFLLLFLFSSIPLRTNRAEAATARPQSGDYACILTDSAYFYSTADDKRGLFLLPRTYYVRLLDYGDEYCRVEYLRDSDKAKRLVGYAKTQDLTFVDYEPMRPYLYYVFELKYRIEDSELTTSDFLTEIVLSCVYYGDYKIGSETYCYVLRSGEFGYVPKPSRLYYEENTEYADRLNNSQPDDESSETAKKADKKNKSSPAQIAILVTVCLLVPILAGLLIKPPKRPPYDMEE